MADLNWTAKWCWTRGAVPRPWNQYAYLRKSVHLHADVRRAIVRVSADARYTLFINSRRVHFGPARFFTSSPSFDSLDIAPYLQSGPNAICAIVHQFGIGTFQSTFRGYSGFLLDGEIETTADTIPLHTPEGWLCRDAKAWRKDVARLTIQMGFQEHFDANADPVGWMEAEHEATEKEGWHPPIVWGPVGIHPWLEMEPRRAPLLVDRIESFSKVVAHFRGENARGYKITDNIYQFAVNEPRRRDKGLIEDAGAMLRDDETTTTVQEPADSEFVMAVLDLGTYRTGHIILDIAEAAGNEIIDILYTEDLDKTGAPRLQSTPDNLNTVADRYRCRPGKQRWEPFFFKGMRYATLIFRNVEQPMKIRFIGLRQVHAGVDDGGSFECSDDRLNQIWQMGKTTQRNCMFDALVDCPWREQAQWWGDARVQGRVMAYAFGDDTLLARGIRQMAQGQDPDGSLQPHPPSDLSQRLPDFALTWIGTIWDHYFHTGRTELIHQCLPAVHRVMEFFKKHEIQDGLVGKFEGFWVFLDWQELYKDDLSGVLNLMYLQGLRWAAALCEIADQTEPAARYLALAEKVALSSEKFFWDPAAGVWRDGFDRLANKPVDQTSQHMNALAILCHLLPQTHSTIARDVLLKSATKRTKVLTASPFFYAYVLEAMIQCGLKAQAIDIIRDKWGEMIDQDAVAFWEHWDGLQSRCHAWSASPVYHLSQQILGISPVEVGWSRIMIAPVVGQLEFARGTVPSPSGPIRIEWEKVAGDQLAVRVELPEGMVGEFVDPMGGARSLTAGNHEFNT